MQHRHMPDLDEGAEVRIHIRGEKEGWVNGVYSDLSDDTTLYLDTRAQPTGDDEVVADLRIEVTSIDAIDY